MRSAICVLVLLFFSVQAVSPWYASVRSVTAADAAGRSAHVHVGILWVKVLASEMIDDEPADYAGAALNNSSENQNHKLFLVKRKRAVRRSDPIGKPILQAILLPCDPDQLLHPVTTAQRASVSEPTLGRTDGPAFLVSGLSPPFLS